MQPMVDSSIELLLLLLKKVDSARLRDSDMHPISPKTPASQYQPIHTENGVEIVTKIF